jgi:hypothetical protein
MNDTPWAFMKGFRESTASITLSLTISEYECPFLLNTSICPIFYLIRQEVNIPRVKN